MSRLYFTPVNQAFTLGSSQIKDTQEEIAQLTKLILENNQNINNNSTKNNKKPPPPETPLQSPATESPSPTQIGNYSRIGYPDQQMAMFRPNTAQDDIDYNLMKVVGHPKFDDIVRNYALINHPEWLLKESVYSPQQPAQQPVPGNNKSNFGNKYQSTLCLDIKKYILFFIFSVVIFIIFTIIL
jgi:hypothetical protein